MKFTSTSFLTLSAFAVGALLATSSCKKSNNDNKFTTNFSAKLNDSTFQTNLSYSTFDQTDTSDIYYNLEGYTVKPNGDTVIMEIDLPPTIKANQTITNNNSNASVGGIYYYEIGGKFEYYPDDLRGGNFSITVTSLDDANHKIAGNFSGKLFSYNVNNNNYDSLTVTNGAFSTSYTVLK